MTIVGKDIELFKELSQIEIDGIFYDFHNDFDCVKISLKDNLLVLYFKNIEKDFIVSIKFLNVIFCKFEFCYDQEIKVLTIDSLYRGRFEMNGNLFEFSEDGKSYFYMDFYEGHKIEFLSEGVMFEKLEI